MKRPDGVRLFNDCLMIWLVSDFSTLILVVTRAKRWWRLLLSMKPLHITWFVDRVACVATLHAYTSAGAGICSPPELCTYEVGLPAHCELKKVELTRGVDCQVRPQVRQ